MIEGQSSTFLDQLQPEVIFRNRDATQAKTVNTAHGSVERVFFRHHISLAHRGDKLNFSHASASLASLTFNFISYGADVEVSVDDAGRALYIMVVPLNGTAEVVHGTNRSSIDRGSYIILDPNAPFRFQMSADHTHLAVGIPHELLNIFSEANNIRQASRHLQFSHRSESITEHNQGLFDFLGFLCREANREKQSANDLGALGALQDTFLKVLLSRTAQSGSNCNNTNANIAIPKTIRLAEQFMLANIKEDILAKDVARASGVSIRTLSNCFRMFRDTSPMQWLKLQRLQRANEDLSNPSQPSSVTEVALRYCASNPGRFASAYYNQFGEYPSETLKKN